jgi:hypothetical protein
MQETKREDTAKRDYSKPTLRTIELLTDEVLGIGCKTAGMGGPEQVQCTIPAQCFTPGS